MEFEIREVPSVTSTPQKIVIGKTWFYVALVLMAALLIFLYREHQKPPENYKEPSFGLSEREN